MHQMMQQKLDSITVVSRTHLLKIAEWLMLVRQASTTLFYVHKTKNAPMTKQQ
jgi:hypothetical protein